MHGIAEKFVGDLGNCNTSLIMKNIIPQWVLFYMSNANHIYKCVYNTNTSPICSHSHGYIVCELFSLYKNKYILFIISLLLIDLASMLLIHIKRCNPENYEIRTIIGVKINKCTLGEFRPNTNMSSYIFSNQLHLFYVYSVCHYSFRVSSFLVQVVIFFK